jgi:epoxide hydrolase-like predicted phosphatase
MIKAVIFDMGSVLIGAEWRIIYKRIAKKLRLSEEKVKKISRPLLDKWNIGKINEREFWKGFEEQLGRKIDCSFTKNLWFRSHINYVRDIRESWKIIAELRAKKVLLAIISNTIPPHVQSHRKTGRISKLRKLGVKFFIWSCSVGLRKPNPKIYKIALKKLKLPAKEYIFIDDKLAHIKAAKKLGMIGIHFQTPKKLKKDLIKLGVL